MTDELNENEDIKTESITREPKHTLSWILGGLLLIAIVIIIWLFIADKPLGQSNSEPVAIVNGETITKDDLYDLMYGEVGEPALEQIITDTLLNQEAKEAGITVTDEEVNEAVEERLASVRSQFPSEEQFLAYLTQQGVTLEAIQEDLKKRLPTDLKIKKIIEPQIDLSDEKVAEHFKEYKLRYTEPESIKASHILVDSKEKAEGILQELQGGADFAELAKKHGTDGTSTKGGDLGYFSKGDMVPEFEEAAFNLKLNELSGVVETQHGFHLIKATDIPKDWTLEDKKEETKEDLLAKELELKMKTWFEETRAKAEIEKF